MDTLLDNTPTDSDVDWPAVVRKLPKATLVELLADQAANGTRDTTCQLRLAAVDAGALDPLVAIRDAANDYRATNTAYNISQGAYERACSAWANHLADLLRHTTNPDDEPRRTLQLAAATLDTVRDHRERIDDSYGSAGDTAYTAIRLLTEATAALHDAGELDDDLRHTISEFLDDQEAGDGYGLLSQPHLTDPYQQLADLGIDTPDTYTW